MAKWHGGKGSTTRKGADDDKYRNGYDRIFSERSSSKPKGNSDSESSNGNAKKRSS